MIASLIFAGWSWLWLALGVLGLAAVALLWSYGRAPATWARLVCPLLKFAGIAALAFCLLEPLWSGQRARSGANLFAVVADNSQGLQVHDRGESQTRAERLRALLDPHAGRWQQTLEDHFEIRRYSFDRRLQAAKDFSELTFDGRSSALGSSLRALAERYRGRPLAGILLLTDGNATDLRGAPDLSGLPPIYPVVIGTRNPIRDLSVHRVHATQTDFEDAPVSIQAEVSAAGFSGQRIVAQLLDLAGKPVAEQMLRTRSDQELLSFRFQFRPEKPGLSFYRLQARAKSELGSGEPQQQSEEATLANNSTVLVVERGHGPYHILYVSGRPNWEFKFLNRALEVDEQLRLSSLIRVAKREPKFNFLGRAGETSNPLFRGFGNQSAEDVERYDQPVLVPMTHKDAPELRNGFPRTSESLYAYHAIIIDDLEAEFFPADQALLLQKFVSERGGGFLMLGGAECFREGNYHRTPIGDMLPVYLDPVNEPPGTNEWRWDLTREGLLQSWARLRDNEAGEKERLEGMAAFQVLNRVREAKPGASVIARVANADGNTYPALAVQRFGKGRTAALTVGDFWRWGLRDPDAHRDMDKAWRQLMRWLVTDVPNKVELTVEPVENDANGAVSLQVRARDPKFMPLDNAAVSLTIQPVMAAGDAATNSIQLRAEASPTEPGLYLANYVPRGTGGYQASAAVTNAENVEVGQAVAGWATDLAADEFRSLTPNFSLLETVAQKTGGEVVSLNRLDEFARNLPRRQAPIMESWNYPLWHTPALFALALACLVSEWGIRRWKGLP